MKTNLKNIKSVIFMAVYNGEPYISQQLDSIINQTYANWELIVSDDESSDRTMEILKKYQKVEDRIKTIIRNSGEHGAYANYYNAMRYIKNQEPSSYQYFFYCDQDDIWASTKMEEQILVLEQMQAKYPEIPMVCYSDLRIITATGDSTNRNLSDFTNIRLENPYNIFFSHRYIWGTTMVHNRKLWDNMDFPEYIPGWISHDNFLPKYAAAFGKIVYMDKPLVLYRRHGNNVSGIPRGYNVFSGLKKILFQMPSVVHNHARTYCASLYFLDHMHSYEENTFTRELRSCLTQGGLQAIKFVCKFRINTSNNLFNKGSFYLILFSGIYKITKEYRGYRNND